MSRIVQVPRRFSVYDTADFTGNFDCSESGRLWQTYSGSTGVTAAVVGDPVGMFYDLALPSTRQQYYASSLDTRPILSAAYFGGRSSLVFDGTDDYLNGTPRIATFLDNDGWSLYVVLTAISITGGSPDTSPYGSPGIVTDGASNWGVHVTAKGGSAIQVYEWDGSPKCNRHAITSGTPYVLAVRSGSGFLRSRLNGGTEISKAIGASAPNPMTGALRWGRNHLSAYANVAIAHVLVSDREHTDAESKHLSAALGSKWGVYLGQDHARRKNTSREDDSRRAAGLHACYDCRARRSGR